MFTGRSRHTPSAFERYLDWRCQLSKCEAAYHEWAAAGIARASAFAAYATALEREEQAAAQYATAVTHS